MAIADTLSTQEVSNTLWAYARMDKTPAAELAMRLDARVAATVHMFNTQDITNTLWAYAKMTSSSSSPGGTYAGAELIGLMEARAAALADNFIAQDVSNILWAYAKMGRRPCSDSEFMQRLERRAVALVPDLSPQNVSNILWAYAALDMRASDALMTLLECRAVNIMRDFSVQEVSTMAWAYACMALPMHPSLVSGITSQIIAAQHADPVALSSQLTMSQLHQFLITYTLEPRLLVQSGSAATSDSDINTLQQLVSSSHNSSRVFSASESESESEFVSESESGKHAVTMSGFQQDVAQVCMYVRMSPSIYAVTVKFMQ